MQNMLGSTVQSLPPLSGLPYNVLPRHVKILKNNSALFPFPPHKYRFHGVTSGFTRLSMKTEYACPYAKFDNKNKPTM